MARAFAGYGIVPGAATPPDIARRINDSLIRESLLAYLETWAVAADRDPNSCGQRRAAADPDEFRDRARLAGYPETAIARAFRGRPVPVPPIWFAFGHGQDAKLPFLVREQLLLAALQERSNSFPLLMTLATLGDPVGREATLRRVGWCRAALAVRPRNIVTWNNLGVALKALGDPRGAARAYEKAMEIDPLSAPAYSNLGNVRRAEGDRSGALKLYARAFERDATFGGGTQQS